FGKLAFAYVTFIGFKMVYTAINVPYSALMGVITDDAEDRVALSTARFLGAFGGGFVVSLMVRPLVGLLGGGNELLGFQWTMALFGFASVGMILVTFFATKQRLEPIPEHVDLKTDLGYLAQNRPWLVMIVAAVCTLAAVAVRGAVTVHYFKYYVGADDSAIFTIGREGTALFLEFDTTTVFLSSGMLAFVAGVSLTTWVSRLLGKRNGLIVLTLLNSATVFSFFFIPADAWSLMMAVNLLGNLLAGPTPALVWALYTDVSDYGEWRFGRRATGLVFSAAMFAQKMGLTIGGAVPGYMLGMFGFVANQEQPPESLMGIRVMFSLLPGALALANGLVLLFYPLSEAQTEEMQTELAVRRQKA
ncbi:MAG: glycoside-pentoside-hexuronide (GPH):cation symporter, partial [Myxococcota bacterium]